MMKTAGIVCVLFALIVGTLVGPAEAAKKKRKVTREAQASYQMPTFGSPSTTGPCVGYGGSSCPTFAISKQEGWVTMEIHDVASPAPVAFSIWQNPDGDTGVGALEDRGTFCGTTGEEPVELTPGAEVGVLIYASGDTVCPGGVGTSGTVKATFSNLP